MFIEAPSILLLEDQPETRAWLERALSQVFPKASVFCAPLVGSALELIEQHQFDLALLDLGLPDGSGLRVLEILGQTMPACLRVVVTAFSDDDHLFDALRLGAQGYVLKDAALSQIASALRDLAEGRPPLSASIARRILSSFNAPEPANPGLTARQQEILALIGKGYSTAEAAKLLGISAHTAQGYVKEIYRLLDIHSRAEAASEAVRLGLVKPI